MNILSFWRYPNSKTFMSWIIGYKTNLTTLIPIIHFANFIPQYSLHSLLIYSHILVSFTRYVVVSDDAHLFLQILRLYVYIVLVYGDGCTEIYALHIEGVGELHLCVLVGDGESLEAKTIEVCGHVVIGVAYIDFALYDDPLYTMHALTGIIICVYWDTGIIPDYPTMIIINR